MLLEPIYGHDFLDCSYGLRPGRSAHQALQSFRNQTIDCQPKGGSVLEVDVRKFFDKLRHQPLRQFLQHRLGDGVLLRLIDKWLKAGVMEDGNVSYAYYGVTGNSGALSKFLHEVGPRWRKWLTRRNRIRSLTWEKFCGILRRYPLAPVCTVR